MKRVRLSVFGFTCVAALSAAQLSAFAEDAFRGGVFDEGQATDVVANTPNETTVSKTSDEALPFKPRKAKRPVKAAVAPKKVVSAVKREPAQIAIVAKPLVVTEEQLAKLRVTLGKSGKVLSVDIVNAPGAVAPSTQAEAFAVDDIYTASLPKAAEPSDDLYSGVLSVAEVQPPQRLYDDNFPARSTSKQVSSLSEAVTLARKNSELIKAFDYDELAAEAGVKREMAAYAPEVTGTLASGYEKNSDGRGVNNYADIGFNLPLYTGGQRRHKIEGAQANVEAVKAKRAATADRITSEVVNAYLQYAYAHRISELLREAQSSTKRVVTKVEEQRDGGFASGSDVQEANLALGSIKRQLADAETNMSRARETIIQMAGRPVSPDLDIRELEHALAVGRDRLRDKAVRDNPRILAATKDYEVARQDALSKYGRAWPQLGVNGNFRHDLDNRLNESGRNQWNVGARLTVPFLNLANTYDNEQSKHQANAAYSRALATKQVVVTEFNTMWAEYVGSLKELQIAEAKIAEVRKGVGIAQVRFEEGQASLSDYLRALAQVKSAQVEREQVMARHVNNMAMVLMTSGSFDTVFPKG
jgi:outer membrane protein